MESKKGEKLKNMLKLNIFHLIMKVKKNINQPQA